MNILYVVPAMFPFGWAYAARARSIAKMIVAAGMNVTVLADYLSDGMEWTEDNLAYDGTIRIVTTSRIKASERTTKDKLLVARRTAQALKEYMGSNRVDCIICSQNTTKFRAAWKISKQMKIPFVLETCEWYSRKNWKFGYADPRYWSFLACWYLKFPRVENAICISRLLEKRFKNFGANVIRVPTILDVDSKPAKVSGELHHPIRLIFVGGITGGKDELGTIITCVCNQEFPFDIYIYGPDITTIDKLLSGTKYNKEAFKKRIHVFGHVDQREIETKLIECDYGILIRPNRRSSNAGFPTKLGEYFSAGLPVLANETGDIGMYLKNGKNGVMLEGNKPQDIIKALEKMVGIEDNEYKLMSQNARESAEKHFKYSNYVEDFMHLISFQESREKGTGK